MNGLSVKEVTMIKLNKQQKDAAGFTHGIASVLAIPGSGKTLTMTHRIGKLVASGVEPDRILGLTYSRNAAQAMRRKLVPILDDQASKVTLSTIHSFCHTLLRTEGRKFEILTGTDQIKFIKKIMKRLKIRNIPTGMILREIGLSKSNLITADEFKELYMDDQIMINIGEIFEAYEGAKRKSLLMDFNDLLMEVYLLLTEDCEIRDKYQQWFSHILIDEFQDLSPVQFEILNLLIGDMNGDRSFWICADDWQSIYSFIGASVGNVLNFGKVFPGSKQFMLNLNYRSTPQILKACQNLIEHNIRKIDKKLTTKNPDGEKVRVLEAVNEEDESVQIVNELKDLHERQGYALNQMAVLYRANSQSRAIEEACIQHRIPYRIENGINFYHRYEVKVLLDYLRLIDAPDSDEGDDALRSIINIPNRYFGRKFQEELEEYAVKRNMHLYPALKTMPVDAPYLRKNVKELTRILDPLMKETTTLNPSELIHILREALDYDSYITDDDIPSPDDSKIENIDQLQMVANRYDNIKSLLNYTETFREESSNDENGVNLMTVHKSKGLEFRAVFVIGFIDGVLPSKNGNLEEERRIAFVGMSRAMEVLYLSYPYSCMNKQTTKSPFLDEIFGNGKRRQIK